MDQGAGYQQTNYQSPAQKKKKWPIIVGVIAILMAIAVVANLMGGQDKTKDDELLTDSSKESALEQQQDSDLSKSESTLPAETTNTPSTETSSTSEPASTEPSVPIEYKNALNKAESYSDLMHMSQAAIYDQLTSEYGEKFSPEAAQYAIDNLDADYNANALEKAKSYQENMSMSPTAIYDQLTSEYGEKFTAEQAQYAIDNLPS